MKTGSFPTNQVVSQTRMFAKDLGRVLVAIALLLAAASVVAGPLVLSPQSLGTLPLGKGAKVSEQQLVKLFPQFVVTYEIGQGDSPDFHYFEVKDKKGDVLFAIKSFIEESAKSKKLDSAVAISILQVYGAQVRDSYGLIIGDRVKDIVKKRGKSLDFSAGHHHVSLGSGDIFYNIPVEIDQSPELLKMGDAIKANGKIRSISWPTAAWE